MATLTVSAGIVSGLSAFAASRGADLHALYARADVDLGALDDPDARLPLETYKTLLRAAQEMCADPALALHWGEAVDMAEVSIVGLIMNASETMGEAFAQMQRLGGSRWKWRASATDRASMSRRATASSGCATTVSIPTISLN